MSFTFSLSIASFFHNGPNGEAESPIVAVPVPSGGIDIQVATAVVAVGRGRPKVTIRTHTAHGTRTGATKTSSRKEYVCAV
jgi:hypothetical protein